ncbi:hypothetical protein HKD37_13G036476 [Glycine soja]
MGGEENFSKYNYNAASNECLIILEGVSTLEHMEMRILGWQFASNRVNPPVVHPKMREPKLLNLTPNLLASQDNSDVIPLVGRASTRWMNSSTIEILNVFSSLGGLYSQVEFLLVGQLVGRDVVNDIFNRCSQTLRKNALGTWVFSVAGALLAIPVGIKRKSLAPLVFFGTTGTMLDIIMGISACEREHAERQMKLLEAQNAADETPLGETEIDS